MEGELIAEGKIAAVTCLLRLIPLPPPSRITGGDFSMACTPPSPFTQLSPACDVIFDKSPPLLVQLLNGHAHEVHLKEETKLNNFLLYGFLIGVLGAEQSAPKDRQKFSKYTRPPKISRSA
jgi:hypothetical protein